MATSYLFLSPDRNILFVDSSKTDAALLEYLAAEGVGVMGYTEAGAFLASLPDAATVLVDPARTSGRMHSLLAGRAVNTALAEEQIGGGHRCVAHIVAAYVESPCNLVECRNEDCAGAGLGEIELMRDGLASTPGIGHWLCINLPEGATVGVDGMLLPVPRLADLQGELQKAGS